MVDTDKEAVADIRGLNDHTLEDLHVQRNLARWEVLRNKYTVF